jgi:hypothetical protein
MAARPRWSGQWGVRYLRRGFALGPWPAREEPGAAGARGAAARAGDGQRLGIGGRIGPGGPADGRTIRDGRRPVATPRHHFPATLGVASLSRGSRLAGPTASVIRATVLVRFSPETSVEREPHQHVSAVFQHAHNHGIRPVYVRPDGEDVPILRSRRAAASCRFRRAERGYRGGCRLRHVRDGGCGPGDTAELVRYGFATDHPADREPAAAPASSATGPGRVADPAAFRREPGAGPGREPGARLGWQPRAGPREQWSGLTAYDAHGTGHPSRQLRPGAYGGTESGSRLARDHADHGVRHGKH